MQEEWRVIKEYPKYSVSSRLRIRNNETGRILKTSGKGTVVLYSGSRDTRVDKSVYGLYLKAFEGYPSETHGRTKIRVIETDEIYYSYREACEGLGLPRCYINSICTAVYHKRKDGERRSVKGYTFELVEDVA